MKATELPQFVVLPWCRSDLIERAFEGHIVQPQSMPPMRLNDRLIQISGPVVRPDRAIVPSDESPQ